MILPLTRVDQEMLYTERKNWIYSPSAIDLEVDRGRESRKILPQNPPAAGADTHITLKRNCIREIFFGTALCPDYRPIRICIDKVRQLSSYKFRK